MLYGFRRAPKDARVLFVKKAWYTKPKFVRSLAVGALAFAIGVGSFLMPEAHAYTAAAFVMVVKTDNPGTSNATSFTIPITGTGYSYNVDCNDDGINEITARTTSYTCAYGAAGTYTIAITGTFPRIYFNNSGDKQKLLEVKQWGTGVWASMGSAFRGCNNLHITATDAPNLTVATDLSRMFEFATSMNENINHWDVSHITNMSYLFTGQWDYVMTYNQPLNNWNTANVTNMSYMFNYASAFNQPLTNFNTSAVTNMSYMFYGASAFNQPLTNFNTSAVTNMSGMFQGASAFNQPLTNFNTSAVTNMSYMFSGASVFNQPLTSFDTSAVTDMSWMFAGASVFNQPLTNFNTSAVTNMSGMFFNASAFNQPLTNFNTSAVTNMSWMFSGASAFNQPLTNWNTGAVTNMSRMFQSGGYDSRMSFNQSIEGWNTGNVTNMSYMFAGSTAFNQPLNSWDVSSVTNMSFMFGASNCWGPCNGDGRQFNQPLDAWNTSAVTNMSGMFQGATAFNQPLTNFNTSAVTNMSQMFQGASAFNQPLTSFNTGAVTDMSGMFSWATAFNQPLTNFNTSAVTNMSQMFNGASAFNQPLTNFNTSVVTDMSQMFSGASAFNQPLTNFNTSAVTNMSGMFNNSGYTTATYDQTLAHFASQSLQPNVALGATGITYCEDTAHITLTSPPNNWTITDGGFCPPAITSPANLAVVSDATPAITGTAKPSRTVHIDLAGSSYTTTASAAGNYSFTTPTALTDGWHTATVRSTDQAGTPGTPTKVAFYVHTGGTLSLSGSVQAPTLNWSAAPPAPTGWLWNQATANADWPARIQHSTVVFNNKLWVMGGYGNGANYNDVWSSPDGVNWTQVTANAQWPARDEFTTVVFNNKLWVFGGWSTTGTYNDVWSSPDGVNWIEETSSAPWSVRYGHSTVVFDNKLWVIGGYGGGTEYNDVWSSQDGINWTQVTASAAWPARNAHASVVFNDKLWVIGGCSDTCNPDGDVWSSSDGATWTQVTPNPLRATTRASWAQPMAQVFDGKLWLMGGYDENWDYSSEVWYTEDGASWTLATDKPGWIPRSDHTTAVFNDKLWVIGGDGDVARLNDVWSTTKPTITYTVCWDTVENGCAQTAQTTNSSFTIPSNLAKGTWHFKVTANIPGTQGIGSYTTAAYTVTDPLPVITPLTGKPVIHPVTGAASTVTLAPTLAEASLSVSSYDCSDVKVPTVRLVEPDGLKAPEANVTLLGGVGFSVGCTGTGKSADVALSFGAVYADTTKLRAYKGTGATLTDITDKVTFVTKDVSGTTRTVLSYTLTDGGSFDEDSIANSTIVDPIYIGVVQGASATAPVATTAAGGSLASTGVSVGVVAVGGVIITGMSIIVLRNIRRRKYVSFRS